LSCEGGGGIFDCDKDFPDYVKNEKQKVYKRIVSRYEVGLSNLILKAGFAISPVLRPVLVFKHNATECDNEHHKDLWLKQHLRRY
jgi:hypothetical protein